MHHAALLLVAEALPCDLALATHSHCGCCTETVSDSNEHTDSGYSTAQTCEVIQRHSVSQAFSPMNSQTSHTHLVQKGHLLVADVH